MLREEAWIELDLEPPEESSSLMADDDFDREAQLAGEGRWEELGLDSLPAGWKPSTVEDLRNADA